MSKLCDNNGDNIYWLLMNNHVMLHVHELWIPQKKHNLETLKPNLETLKPKPNLETLKAKHNLET